MSAMAAPSFDPKRELKVFDKEHLKYETIRGIVGKPRKGRLDNCPGVHFPSGSGKIMRPLPKYFKKEEEVVVAGSDPYMLKMQPKREHKPGK